MPHRADKPQFISHRAGKPLLFWAYQAQYESQKVLPYLKQMQCLDEQLAAQQISLEDLLFNKPTEKPPKLCANKVL